MTTTIQTGGRAAKTASQKRRLPSGKALLAPVLIAVAALGGVVATGQADAAERNEAAEAASLAKAREQAGLKAHELLARQQFLAEITEAEFSGETVAEPAEQPARLADAATITGLAAELPSLADLEAGQMEQVAKLTSIAEARAAAAERTIRRAGLSPRLVAARNADRSAQGGPLQSLAAAEADPRLAALGKAVARMSALEAGVATVPTHVPANLSLVSVSSGFGYRSDPFTGHGAMHAGLDFRGPIGSPVQAAADGTVTFAGSKGGYGNCVEVTHGNGMMTRYAHLSAFKARVGQKVAAGDTIALLGNTGRSTGPHLHFEVRINGAAVNPKPFLNAAA